MTDYHAVMLDETGCEFGVSFRSQTREEAYDYLRENYPESRCVQLEDPTDRAEREQRVYDWACREIEGDFPPDEYYDEY